MGLPVFLYLVVKFIFFKLGHNKNLISSLFYCRKLFLYSLYSYSFLLLKHRKKFNLTLLYQIYYNELDEKTILDIEKSVLEGKNKTLEYFEIQGYDKEIIIDVFDSIEELHLDVFGEKKEEWLVSCENGEYGIKVVSPLNPGNVHNYEVILEVISKSVADIILKNNFKDVPKWLDITTYITGLNTETKTNSKPSIIKLKEEGYFNFSDCYFITRYIVEKFGKRTIIKI